MNSRWWRTSHHPSAIAAPVGAFANPIEREFAALLTLYGVDWDYEPREFILERHSDGRTSRSFRPDFYLTQYNLYIEITALRQPLVTTKNRKIREFRSLYPDQELEVLYRSDLGNFFQRHGLSLPGSAGLVA